MIANHAERLAAKHSTNKGGRPSKYTEALAIGICERIAKGRPLTKICRLKGMPDYSTVLRWRRDRDDFAALYQAAREDAADTLADQVLTIADDASGDVTEDGEGGRVVDHENVQRSRLRVDARKWIACKLKPRVYGERIQHAGHDGGPIGTEVESALTAALAKARGHAQRLTDKTKR